MVTVFLGVDVSDEDEDEEESSEEDDESDTILLFRFLFLFLVGFGCSGPILQGLVCPTQAVAGRPNNNGTLRNQTSCREQQLNRPATLADLLRVGHVLCH